MKRICLLIPDGVGVKTFVHSGLLEELSLTNQIIVWTPYSEAFEKSKLFKNIEIKQVIPQNGYFLSRWIKDLIIHLTLGLNKKNTQNPTLYKYNRKRYKGFKKTLVHIPEAILKRLPKQQSVINWLQKRYKKQTSENASVINAFKESPFDFLLSTNQRGDVTAEVFNTLENHTNVELATCIFSWDNLPKGQMHISPNNYFVWSERMKNELLYFYPEIDSNNIFIAGALQYDFYKKTVEPSSRAEFAVSNKLDETKSWFCFSGDDKGTSPFDHLYLKDLAKAAKQKGSVQILFRPVPVDDLSRYQNVLDEFPDIIIPISAAWEVVGKSWSTKLPLKEDNQMLFDLSYHCKAVFNIGSSMIIDFYMNGKPTFYFKYNQPASDLTWDIEDIYKFYHFQTDSDKLNVGFIESPEQLNNCFDKEMLELVKAEKSKSWVESVIGPIDQDVVKSYTKGIEKILHS